MFFKKHRFLALVAPFVWVSLSPSHGMHHDAEKGESFRPRTAHTSFLERHNAPGPASQWIEKIYEARAKKNMSNPRAAEAVILVCRLHGTKEYLIDRLLQAAVDAYLFQPAYADPASCDRLQRELLWVKKAYQSLRHKTSMDHYYASQVMLMVLTQHLILENEGGETPMPVQRPLSPPLRQEATPVSLRRPSPKKEMPPHSPFLSQKSAVSEPLFSGEYAPVLVDRARTEEREASEDIVEEVRPRSVQEIVRPQEIPLPVQTPALGVSSRPNTTPTQIFPSGGRSTASAATNGSVETVHSSLQSILKRTPSTSAHLLDVVAPVDPSPLEPKRLADDFLKTLGGGPVGGDDSLAISPISSTSEFWLEETPDVWQEGQDEGFGSHMSPSPPLDRSLHADDLLGVLDQLSDQDSSAAFSASSLPPSGPRQRLKQKGTTPITSRLYNGGQSALAPRRLLDDLGASSSKGAQPSRASSPFIPEKYYIHDQDEEVSDVVGGETSQVDGLDQRYLLSTETPEAPESPEDLPVVHAADQDPSLLSLSAAWPSPAASWHPDMTSSAIFPVTIDFGSSEKTAFSRQNFPLAEETFPQNRELSPRYFQRTAEGEAPWGADALRLSQLVSPNARGERDTVPPLSQRVSRNPGVRGDSLSLLDSQKFQLPPAASWHFEETPVKRDPEGRADASKHSGGGRQTYN